MDLHNIITRQFVLNLHTVRKQIYDIHSCLHVRCFILLTIYLLMTCFGPPNTNHAPHSAVECPQNVLTLCNSSCRTQRHPNTKKPFQNPTATARKPLMSFKCARNRSFFGRVFNDTSGPSGFSRSAKTTWACGRLPKNPSPQPKNNFQKEKKVYDFKWPVQKREKGKMWKNKSWKTVFCGISVPCHICQVFVKICCFVACCRTLIL